MSQTQKKHVLGSKHVRLYTQYRYKYTCCCIAIITGFPTPRMELHVMSACLDVIGHIELSSQSFIDGS